jgi:hypothetical protein
VFVKSRLAQHNALPLRNVGAIGSAQHAHLLGIAAADSELASVIVQSGRSRCQVQELGATVRSMASHVDHLAAPIHRVHVTERWATRSGKPSHAAQAAQTASAIP